MNSLLCDACIEQYVETLYRIASTHCRCESCGNETICRYVTVYECKDADRPPSVVLPFQRVAHVTPKVAAR